MELSTATVGSASPRLTAVRRGLGVALFGATAVVALHDFFGLGGPRLDFALGGPLYDAVVIGAGIACLVRSRSAGRERGAWMLIGLAILIWGVGEVYWTSFLFYETPQPAFSPADVCYLAFYPLAYAGLALLVRSRIRQIDRALLMDAVVAALGTAAVGTAFIFDLAADRIGGSSVEMGVLLAYALGDIILLSLVVGVIALTGWRPGRGWTMVLLGFSALVLADIGFILQSADAIFTSGDWTEPVYLLAASLLAVAAWRPAGRQSLAPVRLEGWREFMVPAVFASIMGGMLILQYFNPASALSVILRAATLLAIIFRLGASVRQNQALLERVRTDPLTGLANRGKLQIDLARQCRFATESEPVALALFDLDGFKLYNDTFGHPAGDALLERLGHRLREAIGTAGDAYRIGGDEFCLLLNCERDRFDSALAAAAAALTEEGMGFEVTSSWGAVLIPQEEQQPTAAIQLADMRMYEHKDAGRVSAGSQVSEALLISLEQRQPELGEHVHGVALLAGRVGRRLGLEPHELTLLRRAAELHDIGKIAIPDAILNKPGPLDAGEREFVERHTILGERIIAAAPSLLPVARVVRSSHERFDGTGYPDGLAGGEIPLAARIVFACDAFSAMTSDRPYSKAIGPDEALEELRFCAGGQFDPIVAEALCAEVGAFARSSQNGGEPRVAPLRRAVMREHPSLSSSPVGSLS